MSEDNVIDLKEARDLAAKSENVFQCQCGSQLFWLVSYMSVRCRGCNEIKHSLSWGYRE